MPNRNREWNPEKPGLGDLSHYSIGSSVNEKKNVYVENSHLSTMFHMWLI
jgi:hypothetical protein